MKPTKKQLKQIDDFLSVAEEINFLEPKAGAIEKATVQSIQQIKDAANKARSIKNRANIDATEELKAKGPSVQDIIKSYQTLLKQKTHAGLEALQSGIDKIDNTIITKATGFLDSAKSFLALAGAFKDAMPPQVQKAIDDVNGWVSQAEGVVAQIKQYEELLLKWAGIAKGYIDAGVDALAGAAGDVTKTIGAASTKIGGVVADIKSFIQMAKSLPGGETAFKDKIATAEGMLSKADGILGKVIGIIGLLPNEETINNIHGWYDKIIATWKELGAEGILSKTKIDDNLAAKLGALVTTSEKWLKEAMTIKDSVLSKIVAVQEMLQGLKKVMAWVKTAGDFLQDVKNGDVNAIFKKLQAAWTGIDTTTDIFAGVEWDNALLDKIKELKGKADNFAKLGLTFVEKMTGANADQVKGWVQKAMELAVRMSQGEDVVGQYISIAKKWLQDGLQQVADGTKAASKAVLGQATSFADEVKKFIAGASAIKGVNLSDKIKSTAAWLKTSENIFNKAEEIIGLVVGDKDENGLPDWYDQLNKYWTSNIDGKDFLKGVKFDNDILATVTGFKKSAEEWLGKAQKAGQNLITQINNVRQWVDVLGKAIEIGAGIVSKIENKDWAGLYDDAMNLWKSIGSENGVKDILKGTKLDNKILDKLKDIKQKLSDFVVGGLTDALGGNATLANDVLATVDSSIRFLLTRHEVEDFSKEFKEDKIIITPPPLAPLTPEEEELEFKKLTRGSKAPLIDLLGKMIDQIAAGITDVNAQVDAAYQKTLKAGYQTSAAYKAAKAQYDSAMKIQNETVKLIENILKVATTVLLTAVAPAAGVSAGVIQGIELGIKIFEAIDKGDFGNAATLIGDKLGGGLISTVLSVALPAMLGGQLKQNAELDLQAAFEKGVTSKYEYVKGFIKDVQAKMKEFSDKLGELPDNEAVLNQAKSQILMINKQWQGTAKQILEKYVNTSRDRINEQLAFRNFIGALFANWLLNRTPRTIRGEDPMIVQPVIDQMEKFTAIMAGVDWDTSFGGKVSRFFGMLIHGGIARKAQQDIAKMKTNAKSELARISTEAAWRGAFTS